MQVTAGSASKSFLSCRLSAARRGLCTISAVSWVELSTRRTLLSTQASARIQVRDPDFVSVCSIGCYITTGVETRT